MEFTYQQKVGEIVAADYRAAGIFEKYGIDFCCKGNTSIEEACQRKNIMTEDVMRELKILLSGIEPDETDFQLWSPISLAEHIEQKHHKYVEEVTPVILRNLQKLCHKHGPSHPELYRIHKLFLASAEELAQHMQKEEKILFPLIRKLSATPTSQSVFQKLPNSIIAHPIEVMIEEHEHEGERFAEIESLTNHYQAPADACNTFLVTYALLKEFEQDLHLHIHLENNILFPKALQLGLDQSVNACSL